MNAAKASAKSHKIKQRVLNMRAQFWPHVADEQLWAPLTAKGFAQVPRTIVYIMNIIDQLTKGKPASRAYLAIWCRLFETGIVELPGERTMAGESGFSGERMVDTWRQRMRSLKELGFIDYRAGKEHEFQWVLVWHPYKVIGALDRKVQQKARAALIDRASEIGSVDFGAPQPADNTSAPANGMVPPLTQNPFDQMLKELEA